MKRREGRIVSLVLVVLMIASALSAFSIGMAGNVGTSTSSEAEHVFVSGDSLQYNIEGKTGVVPGTSGDLVSGVKYIQDGGDLYLIYQDYSTRWGNLRYMEYKDGTWSEPLTVGRDYGDMVRCNGRSYIVSSDLEKVFLTIADGTDMQTLHLADGRIVATSIGILDGYVTPFWADIHGNVFSVSESGGFSNPTEIYHTDHSIYKLSYDNGLNIIERDRGTTINTVLSRSNDGWQVESRSTTSSATRSAGSADETKTIDDEFYQRQNETGKWVMIVYLNGDNNLGDNGGLGGGEYDVGDLNEMESAYDNSSLGKFDIVVLWDHKGSDDPNTHVVWIRHDGHGKETTDSTDTVKSPKIDSHFPLLADTNELYMSNYTVFVNFTEWAVNNFPAEHYFVDMWDHGGAYQGVIWDDTAGNDNWPRNHITIEDMHNATLDLYNRLYFTLGRTLDIIGYDTCLTNHGGIQYHNKIMFDFVGASEHTEGGYGWSYDTVLDEMVSTQGNITAEKQAYNLAHEVNADGGIVTYAVVNTTLWDYKWMPAYNALAQAMKHKAGTENKGITDAFSNSETADSSDWKTAHDYWDLINNHIIGDGEISDSDILYWANRCVENMTRNNGSYSPGKLIPYSQDTDTSGKKLMMADTTDKDEVNNYKAQAWIFHENEWDEMINQVDANADVTNAVPTVTLDNPHDGDKIPRADGSVTINGTAADSDGTVQLVQVKIDRGYWQNASGTDSWSYVWNITDVPFGWHHIMARSYDGTDFSNIWPGIDVDIIDNPPAQVSVLNPEGGRIYNGNSINIKWNATDPDNESISISLYYSADGGNSWSAIVQNISNSGSYNWDISSLPDGASYIVCVNATDEAPQTTSAYTGIFSIDKVENDGWYFEAEVSGISGYKNLSMEPLDNDSTASTGNITSTGAYAIGNGWLSAPMDYDYDIKGNWTFTIYGYLTTPYANGSLYAEVYRYNSGNPVLLFNASDDEDFGSYQDSHAFQWTYTADSALIPAGDRVFVQVYANVSSAEGGTSVQAISNPDFASDASGWSNSTTSSSGNSPTADYSSSEGNPAGSIDASISGSGGLFGSASEGTVTWQTDFTYNDGEPATATLSFDRYVKEFSSDASNEYTIYLDTPSGSEYTIYPTTSYSGTDSSWVSDSKSVDTSYFSESGTYTLKIYIDMSAASGGTTTIYFDNVELNLDKPPANFVMQYDSTSADSSVEPSMSRVINVNFQSGWNLISLPWLNNSMNIDDALNGVSWDRAMVYINGQWYTYNEHRDPKFNLGFPDVDNTMGIWVHSTSDSTLTGPGDDIGSTTITLHKGWNLVGYASGTERALSDVMDGINYDCIQTFDGNDIVTLDGNYTMTPGEGYWIHVTSGQTWTVDW